MKVVFCLLGAWLCSCDFAARFTPDQALLAGNNAAPAAPDCASCHAYPLHDVHHAYHLLSPNANFTNLGRSELNGAITCLDCHFNSIRHFGYQRPDSIWVDVDGNESHAKLNPTDRLARVELHACFKPLTIASIGERNPGEALAVATDTLVMQGLRMGKMIQWLTDRAHQDDQVSVSFPPNDVTHPESLATAYRPADLSCSSIACHGQQEARYRWPSAERGLSGCPSVLGNDPTCGETP